jgi:branched-subunit amino acid transport protein
MNPTSAVWLAILAIGAITFAFRLSFIALLDRLRLPTVVRQALRFVPVAALTAIILPELLIHDGAIDLSLTNFRLIAGVFAIVVAWRTRNTLATIAVGLLVLWGLTIVF